MACSNCGKKQGKVESENSAALSYDVLISMGIGEDDASYLLELGVRASAADDRLSVLGVALVASLERAKALEEEVDTRSVALEQVEADYAELETQYNQLTDALEGVHSPVEYSGDDPGDE